jgi:aminopeptidase C
MMGRGNCPKHVEFHFQNKIEKFVHLVGFTIRKFFTMHGHMNIKNCFFYICHVIIIKSQRSQYVENLAFTVTKN